MIIGGKAQQVGNAIMMITWQIYDDHIYLMILSWSSYDANYDHLRLGLLWNGSIWRDSATSMWSWTTYLYLGDHCCHNDGNHYNWDDFDDGDDDDYVGGDDEDFGGVWVVMMKILVGVGGDDVKTVCQWRQSCTFSSFSWWFLFTVILQFPRFVSFHHNNLLFLMIISFHWYSAISQICFFSSQYSPLSNDHFFSLLFCNFPDLFLFHNNFLFLMMISFHCCSAIFPDLFLFITIIFCFWFLRFVSFF